VGIIVSLLTSARESDASYHHHERRMHLGESSAP
jgi:hypothetical protein